ncbi:hypothetical protein CFP56_029236 [Quercus suber]|uniref:Uncharacterized protein n=1 Tax=Quercus suber TaxID=58331 RepID=A0AAW0MC75_QUESU
MCFSVKLHSSTGVNNGAAIKKMDSVEVVVFDFGPHNSQLNVGAEVEEMCGSDRGGCSSYLNLLTAIAKVLHHGKKKQIPF